MMSEHIDDEFLTAYIRRRTQPVHWVTWWSESSDEAAADAMESALCEPATGAMRDLTASGVREAVIRAVLEFPSLRHVVWAEAKSLEEQVAEFLSRGTSVDPM